MKFIETTADKYDDMLNILPPLQYTHWSFIVGEPNDHRVCTVTNMVRASWHGYWHVDGKHYTSDNDITIPEFKQVQPNDVRSGSIKFQPRIPQT